VKLRDRTAAATRRALKRGALTPIATERTVVVDGGIPFVVHVLARLRDKERVTTAQRETGSNPFLPPDPELLVTEISESHTVVLNRFNVLPDHLLIITRRFVDQRELLDRSDIEALAGCMAELDGLGFYNAGVVAGASQPHKHLQLVPLPLGDGPAATPLDAILGETVPNRRIHQLEAFRFPHAMLRFERDRASVPFAEELLDGYHRLLNAVGITDSSTPYNLVVSTSWMLVVPRSREFWEGISVNALGFAGSLLVRDRELLELVRRRGPLQILRSVAESSRRRPE
jgi:ATP adenylyltransferase